VKISVVTPSYNQCGYLRRTMGSILSQAGDFELEWVVVDGGSTDGTVDLLRSVTDPRVRWSSGRDGGQSQAINKGLDSINGDVVTWLNSDDLYMPGALAAVAEAFAMQPSVRWVVGRCDIIDAEDRVIRGGVTRYKNHLLRRFSYRSLLRQNCISQPAVFWRAEFGKRIGGPDESLHYTMDYDLWLRMARASEPLILDRVLAQFRIHDQSKSGQVNREQFDEQYRVAARFFNGDLRSRLAHRFHVEKIVWAYRLMRLLGR
jgi:glycosyltransferase involved in cell wall biosynthesis